MEALLIVLTNKLRKVFKELLQSAKDRESRPLSLLLDSHILEDHDPLRFWLVKISCRTYMFLLVSNQMMSLSSKIKNCL